MAPPSPELIDDLVEEVLLRLPPDDPASLARAALVCKLWCRLVSGAAFRRRFREFHRGAAPLLGVLYNTTTGDDGDRHRHRQVTDDDDDDDGMRSADDDADSDTDDDRPVKRARRTLTTAHFVPTAAYRPAAHTAGGWRAIDARHGRVLLCQGYGPALSVWDPITDERRDLPELPFLRKFGYAAAVTCATAAGAGGNGNSCCCDHLDCHRGPFLVVAINVERYAIDFSVYSSEAGAWSNPTDLEHSRLGSLGNMEQTPGVLVGGGSLYFLAHFNNEIVEFDLATQEVYTSLLPSEFSTLSEHRSVVLMIGDDGELGFAANRGYGQLELWSMVGGGDEGFVLRRVIDLQKLLPSGALIDKSSLQVIGFADGGASRFLFIRTSDRLYSIEINSSHVRKVTNCCGDEDDVVPYISFCTPTISRAWSDTRPTTATVVDSEDDGLLKIVPRRTRTRNPRVYGREWVNK